MCFGIWNTLGLHGALTTCLRFLSILDTAFVACCLFLSTGSCHVWIQIHTMCCCFPRCTTTAFGAQKSALWGCKLAPDPEDLQPHPGSVWVESRAVKNTADGPLLAVGSQFEKKGVFFPFLAFFLWFF